MNCIILRSRRCSGLEASDNLPALIRCSCACGREQEKKGGSESGMFGYLKEGGGRRIFCGNFDRPFFV
jgi:hypothetical protein